MFEKDKYYNNETILLPDQFQNSKDGCELFLKDKIYKQIIEDWNNVELNLQNSWLTYNEKR